MIPVLRTERLVLRPFTLDDLPALAVIHAEESFWWYPLRRAMSEEETKDFLHRVIERYDSDGFGLEALEHRASGTIIGWAGLAVPHFLPEILPAVEVGWRLTGSWRGQGFATEAGVAAVQWGFTEGGLDRIVSIYEPDNTPSGRVMERLGFTLERTTSGTLRGETVRVLELTREQWELRTEAAHG
ncbi:MAG TPA: GNAT family N-acetyltransferase [Acidimicrobiales bacterium]|nr:GNAT family N-acetyltransferase [Acidimicrobiales bacterium]